MLVQLSSPVVICYHLLEAPLRPDKYADLHRSKRRSDSKVVNLQTADVTVMYEADANGNEWFAITHLDRPIGIRFQCFDGAVDPSTYRILSKGNPAFQADEEALLPIIAKKIRTNARLHIPA